MYCFCHDGICWDGSVKRRSVGNWFDFGSKNKAVAGLHYLILIFSSLALAVKSLPLIL